MFHCRTPVICAVLSNLAASLLAYAEQLPIRIYRTADGLASDAVNSIVTDKTGYVWFATQEGLSRFDGSEFANYGTNDGLLSRRMNALLITRDGGLWIGTSQGLSRFHPENSPPRGRRFDNYQLSRVNDRSVISLAEDRDGSIVCGTRSGVFRLRRGARSDPKLEDMAFAETREQVIIALLLDRQGALWIGTQHGLVYRGLDGQMRRYTKRNGLLADSIRSLFEDRQGRVWVGIDRGVCLLGLQPGADGREVASCYPVGHAAVNDAIESSDGRLWLATENGLWFSKAHASGGIRDFQSYGPANGLSDHVISSVAEDRDGNFWLGSETGGAMKIARNGIRTFGEADGLRSSRFGALFENHAGELFAITNGGEHTELIQRFDGRRFSAIPLDACGISNLSWGSKQLGFQTDTGEWWFATASGLCRLPHARFEQLHRTPTKRIYTTRDGLTGNLIFRVFEDSRGDIWIATTDGRGGDGLSRWLRSTGILSQFSQEPKLRNRLPSAIREDSHGSIWIGFLDGGLARFKNNRWLFLGADEGFRYAVSDIFADHLGRVWIGQRGGLMRIDEPASEHPRAVAYTTTQGLSSDDVACITEDLFGRLYIGTGRGLDRLNPSGIVEHFTVGDGFALGRPVAALRDHQGALWFGNMQGLSRWLPDPPQPNVPPPILIRSVRVRGVPQPISELGESAAGPFTLASSQNQMQFDFVSITFRPAEKRRYQYKLESADTDWHSPTETRTVNYATLPPGSYRFLVRAVDSSGAYSSQPASATFTILPPYWQRWWFRLLGLLTFAGILYSGYRTRINAMTARVRLRYEERLDERARIARELHDTLLQSLAGVSLQLDSVAKQMGATSKTADQIQAVRRQVDASFREARQKVLDLRSPALQGRTLPQVLRESLERIAAGNLVHLTINETGEPRALPDEVEEVFLRVGEEAVANAVHHANASKLHVTLAYSGESLTLRIRDNGQGFQLDDARRLAGHWGLRNMRDRSCGIGAQWNISTSPGNGTEIDLTFRLRAGK